jgi:hypothetical protein
VLCEAGKFAQSWEFLDVVSCCHFKVKMCLLIARRIWCWICTHYVSLLQGRHIFMTVKLAWAIVLFEFEYSIRNLKHSEVVLFLLCNELVSSLSSSYFVKKSAPWHCIADLHDNLNARIQFQPLVLHHWIGMFTLPQTKPHLVHVCALMVFLPSPLMLEFVNIVACQQLKNWRWM